VFVDPSFLFKFFPFFFPPSSLFLFFSWPTTNYTQGQSPPLRCFFPPPAGQVFPGEGRQPVWCQPPQLRFFLSVLPPSSARTEFFVSVSRRPFSYIILLFFFRQYYSPGVLVSNSMCLLSFVRSPRLGHIHSLPRDFLHSLDKR